MQNFHRPGGNRDSTLGRHKQNFVHARTQEKGAATPQDTEANLPVSVWGSPAEVWVLSGLPWGRQQSWEVPFGKPSWRSPVDLP